MHFAAAVVFCAAHGAPVMAPTHKRKAGASKEPNIMSAYMILCSFCFAKKHDLPLVRVFPQWDRDGTEFARYAPSAPLAHREDLTIAMQTFATLQISGNYTATSGEITSVIFTQQTDAPFLYSFCSTRST